jgi:hypothetical protein
MCFKYQLPVEKFCAMWTLFAVASISRSSWFLVLSCVHIKVKTFAEVHSILWSDGKSRKEGEKHERQKRISKDKKKARGCSVQ